MAPLLSRFSLAPRTLARATLAWGVLLLPLATDAAIAPPPRPTRYATDRAGVVDEARLRALNERLAQFERDTSNQVLVVVERRLPADTTLEEYATAAFHAWGVGQKGRSNGVVFFAFVDDRKMRIEVGYGLEGSIPDARANQIISLEVAPAFRRGDYAGGVEAAADELMKAARGEAFQGTGRTTAEGGPGALPPWIWGIPLVGLLVAWLAGRNGTTLWEVASRGSMGFAGASALLATFSTPLSQDVRPLALGFGVLLLNLAVAAVVVIGRGASVTGRRRVGLGMIQAGTGLIIASLGVAATSAVIDDAWRLAARAFLAAIPVLLLGALLHSVDPLRVATLFLGRLTFVILLLGCAYLALSWYLVVPAPRTVGLTVVSFVTWMAALLYSRARGWRLAPDVDFRPSGSSGGSDGSSSSYDSSSSSGSDFSGGGGDSGGGGASGSW